MEYREEILQYDPQNRQEQFQKDQILKYIDLCSSDILTRKNEQVHVTSSALILNPTLDKVLMVHHTIFNAYSFVGGHADGERDLLTVAIKEAIEETGVNYVFPLTDNIMSLDILPVEEHIRKGQLVKPHSHLSITYGLIAPENQTISSNTEENFDVKWVAVDALDTICNETHMLPIYQKIIKKMRKIVATEKKNLKLCEIVLPLLKWYDENARILPWRENTDPYRVWVSEIMLQQTRVETVKPYFDRFIQQLPDIQSLASAQEGQLLKLWEGLGYYNRVRNLQKSAQIIMQKYKGKFPNSYSEILTLPGIGDYTAGAIMSISFGKPVPAVDGNVLRVIARLTECYEDVTVLKVKNQMTERLRDIYPVFRSGDFTQSLMELGATICLPSGFPKCELCPIRFLCKAYQSNMQMALPVKTKKKPRKKEKKTVLLLCFENKIAVRQREMNTLLGGLWEFPNLEGAKTTEEVKNILSQWKISIVKIAKGIDKKHIFTHIVWEMESYIIVCGNMSEKFSWVTKEKLANEITLPTAFQAFNKLLM